MNAINENLDVWFNSLATQALDKNRKSTDIWEKYKSDLLETKKILTWLPDKLKHSVMVPIGPKALMRGKIVHTNEVLVNLGETWFAKRTACQARGICDRRIQKCDEMIAKLSKERELLESKKSLPAEKEAFGSDVRPEIVEYVTEEEEQEWRKRHREKEKEYRKKLAQMREMEKKQIVTEEDLFNRLDELELREELEDELNRLHEDDDEDEDDFNFDNHDEESAAEFDIKSSSDICTEKENEIDISNTDHNVNNASKGNSFLQINHNKEESSKPKHRVSFSIDIENDADNEPLRLEIKHSPNAPVAPDFTGVINSPTDLYNSYVKSLNPPSILKNSVNKNAEKEFSAITEEEDEPIETESNIISGIILPDVVARDNMVLNENEEVPTKDMDINSMKRISKFKASRMKKS